MTWRLLLWAIVLMSLGACAGRDTASSGASYTRRAVQPPAAAARCFARNAEEHSSALQARVSTSGNQARTDVAVRNGVPYAEAVFEPAGSGATARIRLYVSTTGSRSDLVQELLEGC